MSLRARMFVLTALSLAAATFTGCRGGDQPPAPTPTPSAVTTAAISATPAVTPGTLAAEAVRRLVETTSIPVPTNARLTWATDGRVLLFASGEVVRTDASLGAPQHLRAPAGTRILAASPDGHTLALGGVDTGALLLWDADAADLGPRTIEGASGRTSVGFTGDGAQIIVTEQNTISAAIYDVRTGGKVGTLTGFQTAAPVFDFITGPDGIGAWHARATVQFAQIPSGALGARLSFEDFVGDASFTRDGRLLLTTTGAQEGGRLVARLQAWDPPTGAERLRITLPDVGARATLSPDGMLVAVAGSSGARILDSKGAELWVDTKHGAATAASFTTDGRALLVLSDGALHRYELPR